MPRAVRGIGEYKLTATKDKTMNNKPTRTIRAIDIWPGMILAEHTQRGRVVDVRHRKQTLEILFADEFAGISTTPEDTVNIVKEF